MRFRRHCGCDAIHPDGGAVSEHDEQVILFNLAALHETQYPELAWLHAIPNGGLRNQRVAIKLKAEGVKAGVWDVFLPVARGGYHGLYIEMKYGKNKLTPSQREFQEFIDRQGYAHMVCYNGETAYHLVEKYLEE